ncbi:hypothetical protein PL8927_780046 [Planktothrix serta PCC 8927]|uniref:Uncharacterized protein n=1 Tax=Planktothrix serta PCC 8927 TaxID=671068 RepID=A0A7Z9BV76_9CYAN|nr:hypothetical protein PL8927_780046 [Planktothrix serta PCC 8927]
MQTDFTIAQGDKIVQPGGFSKLIDYNQIFFQNPPLQNYD